MRKLCLSGFRLVLLVGGATVCLYDSLNQDERQHVTTFFVNKTPHVYM